jgi:hypothetical protein
MTPSVLTEALIEYSCCTYMPILQLSEILFLIIHDNLEPDSDRQWLMKSSHVEFEDDGIICCKT